MVIITIRIGALIIAITTTTTHGTIIGGFNTGPMVERIVTCRITTDITLRTAIITHITTTTTPRMDTKGRMETILMEKEIQQETTRREVVF